MNKKLLFACLAFTAVLSSCDQKDGYSTTTRTIFAPALSIITDLNNETVITKYGNYQFDLEMSTITGMTGTVTSPDLISNNTSLAFTTDLQDYKSTGYDAYFENPEATVKGNSSLKLNNGVIEAVYLYEPTYNNYNGYYYTIENVGDLTFQISAQNPWITIAKYNIGNDYRVNTFQQNTFFQGTTITTYPFNGETQTYNTQDIIYRFILEANEDFTAFTANLVMYNAKFSSVPQEPTKTVVLKGLDVDITARGIKISGKNVVPYMYSEGEGLVENQRYIFNSLEFNTTDSYYINGSISYEVAGMYSARFEGSYIKNFYLK